MGPKSTTVLHISRPTLSNILLATTLKAHPGRLQLSLRGACSFCFTKQCVFSPCICQESPEYAEMPVLWVAPTGWHEAIMSAVRGKNGDESSS